MGLKALKKSLRSEFDKPELTIELVPSTCWCSNVRTLVSKKDWDHLKWHTSMMAKKCCEICGGRGPEWPVECHEKWQYISRKEEKIQKLSRLVALCPACHEVKHFGRAQAVGREKQALRHLNHVNGWTSKKSRKYLELVYKVFLRRSRYSWSLDTQWLIDEYEIYVDV